MRMSEDDPHVGYHDRIDADLRAVDLLLEIQQHLLVGAQNLLEVIWGRLHFLSRAYSFGDEDESN
jgi:hypothetical protein